MKISEAIVALEDLRSIHGDLEILAEECPDDGTYHLPLEEFYVARNVRVSEYVPSKYNYWAMKDTGEVLDICIVI